MLPARFTQTTLRALDWLSEKFLPPDETAAHLKTGRRGEEAAYFYLRRHGYTIIARNYRSPNHRGELDLVGWVREKNRDKKDDTDVLCFIEVKTRTTRAIQPAEAAVDRDKEDDLRRVAWDFLRHLPESRTQPPQPARLSQDGIECRGDVLSVYYDRGFSHPTFELFQNAFSLSYNRGPERRY